MEFAYTAEQEALRSDVRRFIKKEITAEIAAELDPETSTGDTRGLGPRAKELYAKIYDKGWLGITYPREYGGQGGDPLTQYIVEEEFRRAGVDISLGGSGAPAIMAAGTEEQKKYYIPGLIKREIIFALGFTEPHAGADLANLRCSAVKDGDHYVINGQKMYTSSAHMATHIYLMARTDKKAPKHEGISIFLFPMNVEGLTVRPLWTIQNEPTAPMGTTYGTARTNETFYDNVRVHKSCLLGEENKGWRVGAMGLNLDRVGAWRYLISVQRNEDIVNFVKKNTLGDYAPGQNPAVRDKIAEMWIEAQVCRLMTMRSMSIVRKGGNFTYEGSAEKVWAPEHGVRVTEAITQMLGQYGSLLRTSPHAVEKGIFAHNVLGSFQSGINHGSVQVMRDQVARRGLGLPSGRRKSDAKS